MIEQELELSFMMRFADPSRKDRIRSQLSSQKGRRRFVFGLPHFDDFDREVAVKIPARDQSTEGILAMLVSNGADATCYLVSANRDIDAQWMDLGRAIRSIVGRVPGTILISRHGRVGYFEREEPGERYLLADRD